MRTSGIHTSGDRTSGGPPVDTLLSLYVNSPVVSILSPYAPLSSQIASISSRRRIPFAQIATSRAMSEPFFGILTAI